MTVSKRCGYTSRHDENEKRNPSASTPQFLPFSAPALARISTHSSSVPFWNCPQLAAALRHGGNTSIVVILGLYAHHPLPGYETYGIRRAAGAMGVKNATQTTECTALGHPGAPEDVVPRQLPSLPPRAAHPAAACS